MRHERGITVLFVQLSPRYLSVCDNFDARFVSTLAFTLPWMDGGRDKSERVTERVREGEEVRERQRGYGSE